MVKYVKKGLNMQKKGEILKKRLFAYLFIYYFLGDKQLSCLDKSLCIAKIINNVVRVQNFHTAVAFTVWTWSRVKFGDQTVFKIIRNADFLANCSSTGCFRYLESQSKQKIIKLLIKNLVLYLIYRFGVHSKVSVDL